MRQTVSLGNPQINQFIVVGQRIWYSDASTIGMYDLTTRVNHPALIHIGASSTLAWSPVRPSVLFVGITGETGAQVELYDISAATPAALANPSMPAGADSRVAAMSVSPDGTKLWVTVSATTYELQASDATLTGRRFSAPFWPVQSQATGIAGGHQLLAQGGSSEHQDDLAVFDTTVGTPPVAVYHVSVPGFGGLGQIAMSTDGARLYATNGIPPGVHSASARLTTIDRTTGARLDVPLPGDTRSLFVEPSTGRVFVADGNKVVVFDPDGWFAGEVAGVGGARSFAAGS